MVATARIVPGAVPACTRRCKTQQFPGRRSWHAYPQLGQARQLLRQPRNIIAVQVQHADARQRADAGGERSVQVVVQQERLLAQADGGHKVSREVLQAAF